MHKLFSKTVYVESKSKQEERLKKFHQLRKFQWYQLRPSSLLGKI